MGNLFKADWLIWMLSVMSANQRPAPGLTRFGACWAVQDANLRPPACKFSDQWVSEGALRAKTRASIDDSQPFALPATSFTSLPESRIKADLWGNLRGDFLRVP